MVPSFLRFLQGYAVFENGDLPVAVAFVLGLLPICGAQNQIEQIVRGGRLGVQIDPAGLFLCQGGVGGNFDGGYRRTQRRAPLGGKQDQVAPGGDCLYPVLVARHTVLLYHAHTDRTSEKPPGLLEILLFSPCRR